MLWEASLEKANTQSKNEESKCCLHSIHRMFDEPDLFNLFRKRLLRNNFKLRLYLDKTSFDEGSARFQHSRVTRLQALGAEVRLCKGVGPNGVWHKKGVVFDRRYLFVGSSNFTYNARHHNAELCFKLTGTAVQDVLQDFQNARAQFRLWSP